jgi:hypothetical protein
LLPLDRAPDLLIGNLLAFRDAMRKNDYVLPIEKIQNAVRNALVRGPQFVDAFPQRICDRSAEFMTECRE